MVQRTGIAGYDAAAANIELAREQAYASWTPPAAAPAWSGGTTYGLGAFVQIQSGVGVVFKSLANGNVGNNPVTDGGVHWQSMDFATCDHQLGIAVRHRAASEPGRARGNGREQRHPTKLKGSNMTVQSGVQNHDKACLSADAVYQASIISLARRRWHRPMLPILCGIGPYRTSALANGIPDGQYVAALRELGTGGF
jgi:hypothetical protein